MEKYKTILPHSYFFSRNCIKFINMVIKINNVLQWSVFFTKYTIFWVIICLTNIFQYLLHSKNRLKAVLKSMLNDVKFSEIDFLVDSESKWNLKNRLLKWKCDKLHFSFFTESNATRVSLNFLFHEYLYSQLCPKTFIISTVLITLF